MGFFKAIKSFFSGPEETKEDKKLAKAYRKVVEVKPSAITEPIVLVTNELVKAKTSTELKKMTKKALDTYAREEHNIELDGRLTKDKMIVSFNKEIKKKKKK
jgi:hypothetical protein